MKYEKYVCGVGYLIRSKAANWSGNYDVLRIININIRKECIYGNK